ncbi:VOC family protein, partial [Candidatus Pacearchaeota archaeon]|nr:VOC family protein [Candidatus Pacearchaeota archaeon]
ELEKEGNVMFGEFMLEGQWFGAMESAGEHKFAFNEGVSLLVNCDTQEEIDYYWNKLTEGGTESVCGWLKDKYGFSWQITPIVLDEMIKDENKDKAENAMQAMLQMKKIIIKDLEKAFNS